MSASLPVAAEVPRVEPTYPSPRPVRTWWDGLRMGRAEIEAAFRIALGLTVLGIPAGLLWLVLAPRREFRVVDGGFQALEPQSEALIGADGWLLLITGVIGVLAAGLVWRFARSRGVAPILGLAVGMVAESAAAWQVGERLGGAPPEEELTRLGTIAAQGLQLRAMPVLVVGAFLATLVYLVAVSFVPRDDLTRTGASQLNSGPRGLPAAPVGPGPHAVGQARSAPDAADATGLPTAQLSDPRSAVAGDPGP